MEPVEYVVALLEREDRGNGITPEDFPAAMRLFVGDRRPSNPEARLAAARRTLRALQERWRTVRPGESLELAFTL